MQKLDIVLTLVFSLVMLVFMAFPAMKITDWLEEKTGVDTKWRNLIMFSIIILLSLSIGLFLRFA